METKLIAVINDESEIIVREGKAVEGVWIVDSFGYEYPAGITEDLTIIGAELDSDNSIFAMDGKSKLQGAIHNQKCVAVVVYKYQDEPLTIEGAFDNFNDIENYVNIPNYTIKIIPLNLLNSAGW